MSDVDPVIVGESLWTLRKDIHEASAHVTLERRRRGLELRISIDGELRHSQMFREWQLLEQAATEKKTDFLERGWK